MMGWMVLEVAVVGMMGWGAAKEAGAGMRGEVRAGEVPVGAGWIQRSREGRLRRGLVGRVLRCGWFGRGRMGRIFMMRLMRRWWGCFGGWGLRVCVLGEIRWMRLRRRWRLRGILMRFMRLPRWRG